MESEMEELMAQVAYYLLLILRLLLSLSLFGECDGE